MTIRCLNRININPYTVLHRSRWIIIIPPRENWPTISPSSLALATAPIMMRISIQVIPGIIFMLTGTQAEKGNAPQMIPVLPGIWNCPKFTGCSHLCFLLPAMFISAHPRLKPKIPARARKTMTITEKYMLLMPKTGASFSTRRLAMSKSRHWWMTTIYTPYAKTPDGSIEPFGDGGYNTEVIMGAEVETTIKSWKELTD